MIGYAVQAGRALIIPFIWLLPLTGLGATESGVGRCVIRIVTIISLLMPLAPGLAVPILGF